METKQKIFVTIGTAAVVAAAIFGGATLFSGSSNTGAGTTTGSSSTVSSNESAASSSSSTNASTSSSTTSRSGSYKDGTYTKTISYYVPHGGSNSIKVTLVVSGGNIASVTTNDSYADDESGMYISSFESSVNGDATGQSLASYSPSRIGGASLTTEAFAEAISGIRTDAAA